jgi:hypothetical protein
MAATDTSLADAQPSVPALPAWPADLTRTQRRDLKICLPFLFKPLDDGSGWAWHAERAGLTASIKFGAEKNSLVIAVFDDESADEVALWRTELRLTGLWKRRLRQFAGEALVLCQSRPRCPKCGQSVKLRRRGSDSAQFFGCAHYPHCHGSLNIIDHDVEHAV